MSLVRILTGVLVLFLASTMLGNEVNDTTKLYSELDLAVKTYREHLLQRQEALSAILYAKVEELKSFDIPIKRVHRIAFFTRKLVDDLGYISSDWELYRGTIKDPNFSEWKKQYLDAEAKLIAVNYILKDLIYSDILEEDPPYAISAAADRYVLYELLSTIPVTDKLLDVGTGVGTKMILMAIWRPEQEITLNEVDESYTKLLTEELTHLQDMCPNLQVLTGTKKSIGKDAKQYDLVTMINTYHHMKRKKQMVKSIEKHLAMDGEVWLLEGVQEYKTSKEGCNKIMTREALEKSLNQSGLVITLSENLTDQHMVFLKCKF